MIVTHAGFLQAICAAPEDDTPRLVYADWLDEHGDPARAEFIRVQCELAGRFAGYGGQDWKDRSACPSCGTRTNVHGAGCRWLELWRRQEALLHAHRAEWLSTLAGVVAGEVYPPRRPSPPEDYLRAGTFLGHLLNRARFERGFSAHVSLALGEVRHLGPALVRQTPLASLAVLDRAPYRASERGLPSWFWYIDWAQPGVSPAPDFAGHLIPAWLWWGLTSDGEPAAYLEYADETAARRDLDEHALAWARAAAAGAIPAP